MDQTRIEQLRQKYNIPQGGINNTKKTTENASDRIARLKALTQKSEDKGFLRNTFDFKEKGRDIKETGVSIMDTLKTGFQKQKEITERGAYGEQTPLETGLQTAGNFLGTGFGAVMDTAVGAGKLFLNEPTEQAIKGKVTGAVEKFATSDLGKKTIQGYESLSPRAKANIQSTVDIGTILPLTKGAQSIGGKVLSGIEKVAPKSITEATQIIPKLGSKVIQTGERAFENVVKKPTKFVASKVAGLKGEETLETIARNPEYFGIKAKPYEDRIEYTQGIKKTIDERIKALGETGKEYQKIRESSAVAQVPKEEIKNVLANKFGVSYENGVIGVTKESTARLTPSESSKLQNFLDRYADTDELSANAFLNARQELDVLSKFEGGIGKSDNLEKIARELRSFYDEKGKTQIPMLKEVDEKYAPEVRTLNKIKKELIDPKTGSLKDIAFSKVANIMSSSKTSLRTQLEKIRPNIEKEVKILKALEDIDIAKTRIAGNYVQSIMFGGAGIYALTQDPRWALGALIAYPPIIINIVKAYGATRNLSKSVVNGIINKLSKGNKLSKEESNIVAKAIDDTKNIEPTDDIVKTITEKDPEMADQIFSSSRVVEGVEKEGVTDKLGKLLGKDIKNKEGGFMKIAKSEPYKETGNLTTKILKDLEGKTTVSKQYILDATNRGDIKQAEKDLIRGLLQGESDQIKVSDFAEKVKSELLPLKFSTGSQQYENIALPDGVKGKVKNYTERVWESPVKTSAGNIHFGTAINETKNYFGHTRIEDMADNKTRRVIEVQSDLYQKGNLQGELQTKENGYWLTPESKKLTQDKISELKSRGYSKEEIDNLVAKENKSQSLLDARAKEVSKLQQYSNPTAHFRMIREEIKKASQDGIEKLQFPTGETAMKIEGLGSQSMWYMEGGRDLTPDKLKIGMTVGNSTEEGIVAGRVSPDEWIITDVLGDGKFKALPKIYESAWKTGKNALGKEVDKSVIERSMETFDISGKVDTSNPIYKFYEKDIRNYLKRFGGQEVTDKQGVKWIEVPIKKEQGKMPVEAFGFLAPLLAKKKEND